jgi:hypothetical protein
VVRGAEPLVFFDFEEGLKNRGSLCGVDLMDGFAGESSLDTNQQTATNCIFAAKAAEAFGIAQVASPIPHSTARTRAALATSYALGQTHLVPWDIYMGSDAAGSQPRYFGTREQYGDLYDFIHEHAHLLDTYEPVAEIGVLANADWLGHDHVLPRFCQRLAEQQIPFHLLLATSKHARSLIRPADLHAARLVVEFSPTESFCEEDQKTIREVRESGLTRFVPPTADLRTICRMRDLRLLRVEGPEAIYAFPRASPARRSSVIHLVNWNLEAASERAATFHRVTLALLAPPRWGHLTAATYHQPDRESIAVQPELHDDCLRLTLPQIETWGLVELHFGQEVTLGYDP